MRYALKSSLLPLFTLLCAGIAGSGAVGCTPTARSFATGDGGSAGNGQGGDTATSGQGGSGGSGQGGAGGQGGQGGQGGAPALCLTDADCVYGAEWCSGGACMACDNSGPVCDIQCENGWQTYTRNGCYPCACAPPNACASDSDCNDGEQCYTGKFCWDWCPPGDPSCCYGNTCSSAGCTDPNPAGCVKTGCPLTETCVTVGVCAGSSCGCLGASWACTKDCAGGKCMPLE